MSPATTASPTQREPELLGQTVVVIGGSAGIGLETARRARAEGAKLILTGRNPERLRRAASELDALSAAAFDATDPAPLERFFRDLPTKIDHVMVTAGRPHYGRLVDLDFAQARRALDEHLLLVLPVWKEVKHGNGPCGSRVRHLRHTVLPGPAGRTAGSCRSRKILAPTPLRGHAARCVRAGGRGRLPSLKGSDGGQPRDTLRHLGAS